MSDTFLRLMPIGKKGRRNKKHFLDLRGLGIRELCRDGPDLLVLAGPTMQLDGDAAVFRWKDVEDLRGECLVGRDDLTRVLKLPYGPGDREDTDHPEGMTVYAANGRRRSVLVVYDSPREARKVGSSAVRADVFELP